ncbi:hypothetical protein QFZ31_003410 [Neobacillus niacini]|nr:hypothetical protein [Neobacillus niacini]
MEKYIERIKQVYLAFPSWIVSQMKLAKIMMY